MKQEIAAKAENNKIAPRLRPGEEMPSIPEGFVPTRLDGEIVFVSAVEDTDSNYGKSSYTERQVSQLNGIRALRMEKELAVTEAEIILFQARVVNHKPKQYVSYD